MKKLKFVWIDDQPRRIAPFKPIFLEGLQKPRLSASVEEICVEADLLKTLGNWVLSRASQAPDLFIIDHIFNTALPFKLNGSSVAHLLRNTFPQTPMVCVTAQFDSPNLFDQEDLSEYTGVFVFSHLAQSIEDLFKIARDFPKLSFPKGDAREHLVDCLKPPERDRAELLLLLPEEFQSSNHPATQNRMGRWIYSLLLARPGFLYDELHVATLLGLTQAGFRKVIDMFVKARYKGVFAMESKPRWWVSEVHRILFSGKGPESPSVPQIAGRNLPGIDAGDYSLCYVSKKTEPPPDTVALADATKGATHRVVRRVYAKQHPNDPGTTPGFETRYVIARRRS
jgi:hypothetical protein